ncbi:hypothetical protein [Halomonas sp.]|uniref:hypothetical protein n=1 Tax=Halomonas sp. TaxID=1486246 RepID=UPI003D142AFF
MKSNSKWKDKLLSSSFPLEYEAMKILVEKGFSVSSEFSYSRLDGDVVKDFSVDIEALAFAPFSDPNDITGTVRLLVECKYRKDGVAWLFLPDPNDPSFSPFVMGHTIRAVDCFSKDILSPNSMVPFDDRGNVVFCFKGVEVDTLNPSAHDAQIKHGVNQLHYALPVMLEKEINNNSFPQSDPAKPFFIVPILLTNAELYIADEEFSMRLVMENDSLDDIAFRAPYVITYNDISPDFESHCTAVFENGIFFDAEYLSEIGSYRSSEGEYENCLPLNVIESLESNRMFEMKRYFTQYIVCSWDGFPELVEDIKNTISTALKDVGRGGG